MHSKELYPLLFAGDDPRFLVSEVCEALLDVPEEEFYKDAVSSVMPTVIRKEDKKTLSLVPK